jgi:hypothetical protein
VTSALISSSAGDYGDSALISASPRLLETNRILPGSLRRMAFRPLNPTSRPATRSHAHAHARVRRGATFVTFAARGRAAYVLTSVNIVNIRREIDEVDDPRFCLPQGDNANDGNDPRSRGRDRCHVDDFRDVCAFDRPRRHLRNPPLQA